MHRLKYTNEAEADLEEAISHIAKESVTNALQYLSGYEDKVELLRHNPLMGTECKNKLINRDCRVFVYESHIVIYKVVVGVNEILIVRIFHGSVDYANRLNKKSRSQLDLLK